MDTLYVTDLDGTLLNTKDSISEYSLETINSLINQGLKFTYATARSLVSATTVTDGLNINIPVIVYNGAFIMNAKNGKILYSQVFSRKEQEDIIELLNKCQIYPLVYAFIDGIEKVSWYSEKENEGIKRYLSLRKGDVRLNSLTMDQNIYEGEMFYFTCIGEREELQIIYDTLKDNEHYTCIFHQELYRPEYWCEILPKKATKANAIKHLKEIWNCNKIISFGDAINDIPMFEISDECYAVENAVPELKKYATRIIQENDSDGVALWLCENTKKYLILN